MAPFTSPNTPDTITFMNSILDPNSSASHDLFKTSMSLFTHPESSNVEPLPHLDYLLINKLVELARPHLNKHQLKRIEYMVDGRKSYYQSHSKFQTAYRDLSDADGCATILDKKAEELNQKLENAISIESNNTPTIRQDLDAINLQRQSNNEDLRIRLEKLQKETKTRQVVSAWFSNLKVEFVKSEMPVLVAYGKQAYKEAMEKEKQAASSADGSQPAEGPHAGEAVNGAESDHCSGSGGSSIAEGEMQGLGLGSNQNEGNGKEKEKEGGAISTAEGGMQGLRLGLNESEGNGKEKEGGGTSTAEGKMQGLDLGSNEVEGKGKEKEVVL